MTAPTITTYVRYLLANVIVPDEASREVAGRDPQSAAAAAPDRAYAFTFYEKASAPFNGGKMSSRPMNESGTYYINGVRLDEAAVEALGDRYSVLLANMRSNRWPAVVRCRAGNYQPLYDGDEIVRTP